jgi:hypothetical protein
MTSSRARLAGTTRPWRVPFQRTKYGRELLVDASFLSDLRAFEPTARPHTLTFYDILLVTRGRGTYQLDDRTYTVAPGTVFFTQPGQIRRWETSNLDGACLFFARDFVSETFRDARFLEQFPFFGAGSREAAIRLTRDERQAFLGAFSATSSEIRMLSGDAPTSSVRGCTGCWCCSTGGTVRAIRPAPRRMFTRPSAVSAPWSNGISRAAIA